jgi:hypothetical protein
VKKEELKEILNNKITSEGNNALTTVKINCKIEKMYRTMSKGIEIIADIIKNEKILEHKCSQ